MKTKVFIFFLVTTIFAFACNNNNTVESDHDHELETEYEHEAEHEEESEKVKFQYTVYTNDFELFAEADPFIVGETGNVLSHFTNLADFKPLTNAKVMLKLQVNGKEVMETKETSDRPGIYSFDVSPTEAGTGNLIFVISSQEGNSQIIVSEITVFASEELAHKAAEASEISTTNTAVFTKEQSWKIDFKTELPLVEPFGQVIKTTALVKSAPDDVFVVTAKSNGVVQFLVSNIVIGKSVQSGSNLFTVSGNQLAVNNTSVLFAETKNNYETAKTEYERKMVLAKDKIISEKELLDAKNKFENARINYENLEENFNKEGELVKSPVDGYFSEIIIENGTYVEQGAPLVKIARNRQLLLNAEIQPKYAKLLNNFSGATIRTMGKAEVISLDQLNGKLVSVGKTIGTNNFLVPVNLKIDNSEAIIPGEFVELYLKTTSEENKIIIPNSAILEEQGFYYVFVQQTPELFEKREVKTGETDGLRTIVSNGISANERVVTQGAMLVKLSQATGTLDAHSGHVH